MFNNMPVNDNRSFLIILSYKKVLIKILGLVLFCMMFSPVRAALEHGIPQQDNQGELKRRVPKRKASEKAIEKIRKVIAIEEGKVTGIQKQDGHEILLASAQLTCIGEDELRRKRVSREKKRAEEQENSLSRESVNNDWDTVPAEIKVQESISATHPDKKRVSMYTYRAAWPAEDIAHLQAAKRILNNLLKQGIRGVPRKQVLSVDQLRCLRAAYKERYREKCYKERLQKMGIQQSVQDSVQLSGPVAMPVIIHEEQKPVAYEVLRAACDSQSESVFSQQFALEERRAGEIIAAQELEGHQALPVAAIFLNQQAGEKKLLIRDAHKSGQLSKSVAMSVITNEEQNPVVYKALRADCDPQCNVLSETRCKGIVLQEPQQKEWLGQDVFTEKRTLLDSDVQENVQLDKLIEVKKKPLSGYRATLSAEDRVFLKNAESKLKGLRGMGISRLDVLSLKEWKCLRAAEIDRTKRYRNRKLQEKAKKMQEFMFDQQLVQEEDTFINSFFNEEACDVSKRGTSIDNDRKRQEEKMPLEIKNNQVRNKRVR